MIIYWGGEMAGVPSKLACCISRSFICCSRSISMMRGTTRIRKVVPAIQAAFPVLLRSFFAAKAVSAATLIPWCTIEEFDTEFENLARIPSLLLLPLLPGRDSDGLLFWDAIDGGFVMTVDEENLTPWIIKVDKQPSKTLHSMNESYRIKQT